MSLSRFSKRRHDPEDAAATYLAGMLPRRRRRQFERHLLDCEDCWRQVRLARDGRAIAEHARELAPHGLRERIRGVIALADETDQPRQMSRWVFIAPALAALLVFSTLGLMLVAHVVGSRQPAVIDAAAAVYQRGEIPSSPAQRSAPDLSAAGLQLLGGGHRMLGDRPVDVFAYRRTRETPVFLYIAGGAFPEARGATPHSSMSTGWTASVSGETMICGTRPFNFLLVGSSSRVVKAASAALGSPPAPGS